MVENEVVNEILRQAIGQNAVITLLCVTGLMVLQRVLDHRSRVLAQDKESKRDDNLQLVATTLKEVVIIVQELRATNISNTKERVGKVIELALKRSEKDFFIYTRNHLNKDISSSNIEADFLRYAETQFNKVDSALSIFEYGGRPINKISIEWFRNIANTITEEIKKNGDNTVTLNIIESRLKSLFESYMFTITKEVTK